MIRETQCFGVCDEEGLIQDAEIEPVVEIYLRGESIDHFAVDRIDSAVEGPIDSHTYWRQTNIASSQETVRVIRWDSDTTGVLIAADSDQIDEWTRNIGFESASADPAPAPGPPPEPTPEPPPEPTSVPAQTDESGSAATPAATPTEPSAETHPWKMVSIGLGAMLVGVVLTATAMKLFS